MKKKKPKPTNGFVSLYVRVPRKTADDLKFLIAAEEKRRDGRNVTQCDVIADCLHGARYGKFLTPEGRWEAIDNLK
jgi:hypothetical protein